MSDSENTPHLEIVAGPNGSGKTTFAQSYLVRAMKRTNYLNPDIIVSGVSPSYSPDAAFQAGRIFLIELKERVLKRESVSFETTLSGLSYLRLLQDAKAAGYTITIYFLYTNSSRTNVQRIKKRVRMGGHHIATKDVLRRYGRSFANFWNRYRILADDWLVFDNSGFSPVLVQSKDAFRQLSNHDAQKFEEKFLKGKL